ncbi:MAG: hypothetical protein NZO16_02760 [Deltaproteobacteria bacterium]|nr:hypothetical protein [Deltaproteobacteria bacterium]
MLAEAHYEGFTCELSVECCKRGPTFSLGTAMIISIEPMDLSEKGIKLKFPYD